MYIIFSHGQIVSWFSDIFVGTGGVLFCSFSVSVSFLNLADYFLGLGACGEMYLLRSLFR